MANSWMAKLSAACVVGKETSASLEPTEHFHIPTSQKLRAFSQWRSTDLLSRDYLSNQRVLVKETLSANDSRAATPSTSVSIPPRRETRVASCAQPLSIALAKPAGKKKYKSFSATV